MPNPIGALFCHGLGCIWFSCADGPAGGREEGLRLLFYSGSLGLGHVTRDLGLARQLRKELPGASVDWLAAPPALEALKGAGEYVLPQAQRLLNLSHEAECVAQGSRLNLTRYLSRVRQKWRLNAVIVGEVLTTTSYDCMIGDETYEVAAARGYGRITRNLPFVMIYDFVGLETHSFNPIERFGVWCSCKRWVKLFSADLSLFVGELEDVPDEPFGFLLPNRRKFARANYKFIGYMLPFSPGVPDRELTRSELGYGPEPLIVCSIGGTSVGKQLLELCTTAWPLLRQRQSTLRMVLVCGPRLDPDCVRAPEGITVLGYVADLYRHFAAADLAIVLGGGSTTLELTALRRPFLYFPIEGHSEQEGCVSRRLARHRAGERLTLSRTGPEQLAERALAWLGREVDYEHIPTDGARLGAEEIAGLLARRQP